MRSRRYTARVEMVDEGQEPSRFGPASLILIGFIIGLIGALYYAWILNPTIYLNASPARLQTKDKAEYIFLVSQSYAATGDWEQAQERLAALNDDEIVDTVAAQLESYLREGKPAAHTEDMMALFTEVYRPVNGLGFDDRVNEVRSEFRALKLQGGIR